MALPPDALLAQMEMFPFLGFFGVMALFVIGGLVVSLLIAIWVYRDAEERGMDGILWLIVVLVANIVGLIVYLVVRADHPKDGGSQGRPKRPGRTQQRGPFCPDCGAEVDAGDRYCGSCGTELPPAG